MSRENNKENDLLSKEMIQYLSTKDLIKAAGGWNEGHYVFRTGEHGNGYIEKMGFLRQPQVMTEMGRRLAIQYKDLADNIDVVVGPSIIGAIIAYSTAAELGKPFTLTYRSNDKTKLNFHRGFVPDKGSRCLFVDDFVFSGKDLTDNVRFMQDSNLTVVGVSVIGYRNEIPLDVPFRGLVNVDFTKSIPDNCQSCIDGIPITSTNIRE